MATIKEVQEKADAIVQPLIDSIVSYQAEHLKTNKGYWQGIRTPQSVPKDGADTPPEKEVKPVNDEEAKAWSEVAVDVPAVLPCSIEVHTHDGPKGKGFSIIASVEVGTQRFMKSIGVGDEGRSFTWQEVRERGIDR